MEQACREMGLSMSAAFTIFAKKVGREHRAHFEQHDLIEGTNENFMGRKSL